MPKVYLWEAMPEPSSSRSMMGMDALPPPTMPIRIALCVAAAGTNGGPVSLSLQLVHVIFLRCTNPLLAHRADSLRCEGSDVIGAKRTCRGRRERVNLTKMTQLRHWVCAAMTCSR